MGVLVVVDGRHCLPGEATVSVFDRGFLYGDSVFETLRTYGGVAFELDEHLRRLESSAARVYIPMPIARDQLRAEVLEAISAAGNAESHVRLMITRGEGQLGLDPALADRPRRVLIVQALHPPPAEQYETGIAAITYRTERVVDATSARGAKIGNYLISVLAMRQARLSGAHEALIQDGQGRILEGASSNVFVVQRGTLITPPEEAGILAGITRAHLLALATELALPSELDALELPAVLAAEEVFISSSIRELLAVVRLDGQTIGTGKPGPVYRRLLAAFRARARGARPASGA
ncbi:MAG TPA: aminotransferase class IV [Polyangiaceae bacterium]|nr:aminotransferase class IV [Polyangiaceae bacterium]